MATQRYISHSRKDSDGDITALCNPGQFWSPVLKWTAISDIESGLYEYWVNWAGSPATRIRVVNGPYGKSLRTASQNQTRRTRRQQLGRVAGSPLNPYFAGVAELKPDVHANYPVTAPCSGHSAMR